MRWPWSSRERVHESKKKIAEHDEDLAELEQQRPEVRHLNAYANGQLRQNHLTQLVGEIPPRRRHA